MIAIRPARDEELAALQRIEAEADRLFAQVGLEVVLTMGQASIERLREGPCWVACDAADRPLGFALAGSLDGHALLDQLSVLPAHGRQGVGRALMETVCAWARGSGFATVILFTYRDVPWNGPFYARLGFEELPAQGWTPGIRAAVDREAALGHPPGRRAVMIRRLEAPAGSRA